MHPTTLLALAVRTQTAVCALAPPATRLRRARTSATLAADEAAAEDVTVAVPRRWRGDDGQATTEYALVLLAAALVALLVVGWATAGGGAAKVGRLFDRVIDSVIDKV